MWVAEGNDTESSQHSDACIGSLALSHERANRSEDILLIDTEFARLLEVICEDVQEQFRVRRGVDVTVGRLIHELE